MDDKDYAFLAELIETPSPSGHEQPVQRLIRRKLEGVAEAIHTDMMGNLIARLAGPGESAARVMLTGHCDEIGFMVRYIDEQGFVYFTPIGGIDAHLVPGQRVRVHTAEGPLLGVIGKKPIHMMEAKDKESVAKFKDLFIDLGFQSREEAQAKVAIGDPATFAVGLERLQGDRVTGRAFDDKMGAFVVAQVLQEVQRRGELPVNLYGVSTVQEELGLRGAVTSAYEVRPDLALVVEVGFATDFPGMEKKEIGEFKVGGGPILSRGANINPALFELLARTAREENIPFQIIGEPRATGTDANVVQISRRGVATALVRVPLRYMHTPVEVLSLTDLENAIRLLAAVLYRIGDREDFTPQ
ncbi:MAG: M42 family metallopeptidase [Desulfuromonadales bacterium]